MDGILKTLFVISKNAHVSKNIREFIFKKKSKIFQSGVKTCPGQKLSKPKNVNRENTWKNVH